MNAQQIPFSEACIFVRDHHRHHRPPIGHKFSIGAYDESGLVGVAIVGRPVARRLDKPGRFEVTRLCTLGKRNACSFLYAACAREAKKRGGKWIFTYILKAEPGTSLKAAGWHKTILTPGKPWGNKKRPRVDKHPLGPKWRYEKFL